MMGDGSAYAALGVDPDADSAAIEQAYKRLIKEHHPDRSGGDAARAAEINRAYRELRAIRELKDPLELNDHEGVEREGRGWLTLLLFILVAAGLFFIARAPLSPLVNRAISSAGLKASESSTKDAAAEQDIMDQPLHAGVIDAAARRALNLSRTSDEMGLASASRDCHRLLRSSPTLRELDRCAAFDDAVVQLQNRDPLRDQGPFSELAVTGRLWSAANRISNDSVAIDGRLDRIRLRVELLLAPLAVPKNA